MPKRTKAKTTTVQVPKEYHDLAKLIAERNALGIVRKWTRASLMRARLPYLRKLRALWSDVWRIREEKNIFSNPEIEGKFAKITKIREQMASDKNVVKYSKIVKGLNSEIKAYGLDATEGKIPSALQTVGIDVMGLATELASKISA